MNHYAKLLAYIQSNSNVTYPDKTTEFIILYASGKTVSESARIIGIAPTTCSQWLGYKWWNGAFRIASASVSQEQSRKFNEIIEMSREGILDRLLHGDVIKGTTGNARRKKISASDLTRIFSTFLDKRQLINGDPTEITETKSQSETLEELKKNFDSMQTGASGVSPIEGGDQSTAEESDDSEDTLTH